MLQLHGSNLILIPKTIITFYTTTTHSAIRSLNFPSLNTTQSSAKMMSLRNIARSAPRALARASTTSTLARCQRTSILSARTSSLLRTQQVSAFSTSLLRRAAEVDEEVSAKLASEIEFENDVKQNEPLPASIKDFLDNSPFKVEDVAGKEDVILTRTFGDEK